MRVTALFQRREQIFRVDGLLVMKNGLLNRVAASGVDFRMAQCVAAGQDGLPCERLAQEWPHDISY